MPCSERLCAALRERALAESNLQGCTGVSYSSAANISSIEATEKARWKVVESCFKVICCALDDGSVAEVRKECRRWWYRCIYGQYKAITKLLEQGAGQGASVSFECGAMKSVRKRVLKGGEKWLERVVRAVVDKIFLSDAQENENLRRKKEEGCKVLAACLHYAGDIRRYQNLLKDARILYELARLALPGDASVYFKLSSLLYNDYPGKCSISAVYFGCRGGPGIGETNLRAICQDFLEPRNHGSLATSNKCYGELKKNFLNRYVSICAKIANLLDADDQLGENVVDREFWIAASTLLQGEAGCQNDSLSTSEVMIAVGIAIYALDQMNEKRPGPLEQADHISKVTGTFMCRLIVTLGNHALDVLKKFNKIVKNKKIRKRQKRKRRTDGTSANHQSPGKNVVESLTLFGASCDFATLQRALGPLSMLSHYFGKAVKIREQDGLCQYKQVFDIIKEVLDSIQLLAQKCGTQSILAAVQSGSNSPGTLPPLYEDLALIGFGPCERAGLFKYVRKPLFDIKVIFKDPSKTYLIRRACTDCDGYFIDDAVGLSFGSKNMHLQVYGEQIIRQTLPLNQAIDGKLVRAILSLCLRSCRIGRLYFCLWKYGGGRIARFNSQPELDQCVVLEESISLLKRRKDEQERGTGSSKPSVSNGSEDLPTLEPARKRVRTDTIVAQNVSPSNGKTSCLIPQIEIADVGGNQQAPLSRTKVADIPVTSGTGQERDISSLESAPNAESGGTPNGPHTPKEPSLVCASQSPLGVRRERLMRREAFSDAWLEALDPDRDLLRLNERSPPVAWWRKPMKRDPNPFF